MERYHDTMGSTANFYDNNRNMIGKDIKLTSGGTLMSTTNTRDRMNFRVGWNRVDTIFTTGYDETWTLDSAYRLVFRDLDNGFFTEDTPTNGAQNWLTKTEDDGVSPVTTNYVHNTMNEYTDRYITSPGEGPMTWDDNGNLVTEVVDLSTGDLLHYTWDPHNRLRGVSFEAGGSLLLAEEESKWPKPKKAIPMEQETKESTLLGGPVDIARYNYFTNNMRSEAVAENTTVDRHQHFYWDGAEIVQVFSVSGSNQTIQKTFVNGRILDEHLLILYGANEAWLHADEHGNVLQVSDDTGNTLDEIYFQDQHGGTAFFDGSGTPLTVSQLLGNPYFFQGRELDYETQNYYFRNRYYEWSPIPQFLSRDRGDIWGDPLSLGDATNAFAGNPVNMSDGYGLYTIGINEEKCTATLRFKLQLFFEDGPKGREWNDQLKAAWAKKAEEVIEKFWSDKWVIKGYTKSYVKYYTDPNCGQNWEADLCPCLKNGFMTKVDLEVQVEGFMADDFEATVHMNDRFYRSTTYPGLKTADLGLDDLTPRKDLGAPGQIVLLHEFGHMIGLDHPNFGNAPANSPQEYNDPVTGKPSKDVLGTGMQLGWKNMEQWRAAVEERFPRCGPYLIEKP